MTKPSKATLRRMHICDAAIQVLGTQGAAGFSHHKVDDAAEIARGSTSYYYRTKLALLLATLTRITELDAADVSEFLGQDGLKMTRSAQFLHDWLSGEKLIRTRARLELFMLGASEPEICEQVRQGRQTIKNLIRSVAQNIFPTADPKTQNHLLDMAIMTIDGLMFKVIREQSEPPSPMEIELILDFWVQQLSQAASASDPA